MAPRKKLPQKNVEFEVERIVGDKYVGRKRFFFIKWKNFATSENTWEPEENLTKCSPLLRDYFNGKGLKNSKSQTLSTALVRSITVSKQRRSSISSLISISSPKTSRKLIANSPRVHLVRIDLPEILSKVQIEPPYDSQKIDKSNVYELSTVNTPVSDSSDMSLSIQLSDESVDHLSEHSEVNDFSPKCPRLTVKLQRVSSWESFDSKPADILHNSSETVPSLPDINESNSLENNESQASSSDADKTEQNSVPTNSTVALSGRCSSSPEPNSQITVHVFEQIPRPEVPLAPPVLDNVLDGIEDSDEELLTMRNFDEADDEENLTKKKGTKKRARRKF